jgi:RNA polymerase sigma-70 factor (ECF subfamily)
MLKVVRGVLGATHSDVEDTLQEAMVAVHLALPGFRGECTTLHFACRIAVQTAMNARRRAGYRTRITPSHEPEELAALACDDRSPADLAMAEQRREGLRRLVSELPEPQAEVLALHAVLGYTVEETAAVTAAPINTVRSRLRNALVKLRARLSADGALHEAVRGEP